jgi:ADP-ribosyl-[dinitrogen reductase] hydrolase
MTVIEIDVPGLPGRLAFGPAPGRKDQTAPPNQRDRDLASDLDALARRSVTVVVSLVEEHELLTLGIAAIADEVRARGMDWLHRPIADYGVPSATFEAGWPATRDRLRLALAAGGTVFLHCRGGFGRSGTVATRLLAELGLPPAEALTRVRAARPGAVETAAQERWALSGPLQDGAGSV